MRLGLADCLRGEESGKGLGEPLPRHFPEPALGASTTATLERGSSTFFRRLTFERSWLSPRALVGIRTLSDAVCALGLGVNDVHGGTSEVERRRDTGDASGCTSSYALETETMPELLSESQATEGVAVPDVLTVKSGPVASTVRNLVSGVASTGAVRTGRAPEPSARQTKKGFDGSAPEAGLAIASAAWLHWRKYALRGVVAGDCPPPEDMRETECDVTTGVGPSALLPECSNTRRTGVRSAKRIGMSRLA
mmetsp:Transcript_8150/g.17751  ORF Transcript_8150/g.17751 Transcript_8150/m.17751 type:complete len:251 (-) Transcript_8150:210-962(-)